MAEPEPNAQKTPAFRYADTTQWTQQFVNAMAHLYRGELGRIMVWRQRLDTTTTWAIGSTTTIIGLCFSYREAPHTLILVNMIMVWILLWIEGRRYRFYDAFRARVRMLEAHFYAPLVKQDIKMLEGDWRDLLCEDLLIPTFKMSASEAVGRRLKRNYIWLYAVLLGAWVEKLFLHAPAPIRSWSDFVDAIGQSLLPGWVLLLFLVVFYGFLVGLLVHTIRKSSEEVRQPGHHKRRWKI